MKRKVSSLLLIAGFLAVLFCPHVLWHFVGAQSVEENTENTEKRTLAQKPEFSLEEIDAYPKAYEEYYNDHLPFRNQLIKLYNSLLYHVTNTSSHDNVIIGKDGWLFYKSPMDGTTMECYSGSVLFSDEELEWIATNLTDMRDRLAQQGTEFIVFIAPNKERFYSEYMPDYYGEQAEECMLTQVLSYLRLHTDIKVVFPYEEMLAYKQSYPQQRLYYKRDTHWNGNGGYIGARALLAELGVEIPPLEQYEIMTAPEEYGDLSNMLNVMGLAEGTLYPGARLSSSVDQNEMESGVQNMPLPKLMMRVDSFGEGMSPYIHMVLPEAILTHYTVFTPEMVWEEKPDVFVYEIVERYVRWLRNPILGQKNAD